MNGRLERVEEWNASRPTDCCQCDKPIGWGTAAVYDPRAPWLALHSTCLQELVPERIVAIYDEIATDEELSCGQRERLTKDLERLEREIEYVGRVIVGPPPRDLPGWMRPGIRCEPPIRRH